MFPRQRPAHLEQRLGKALSSPITGGVLTFSTKGLTAPTIVPLPAKTFRFAGIMQTKRGLLPTVLRTINGYCFVPARACRALPRSNAFPSFRAGQRSSAPHQREFRIRRSGLAHLYFESIHPFEDGNGRIGRAISENSLSENLGRPALTSLAATILLRRKDYYAALEAANKSNEITRWLA